MIERQHKISGLRPGKSNYEWRRVIFMLLGVILFCIVYFSPSWGDAIDQGGKHFSLTAQGKAAIAIFLLAGIWWVFEVVPIGVTGIAVGVLQALFQVRDSREVFGDFMDPSVWFIFGSIVIGIAFARTGLTRRMAYRMLMLVGERTSLIYLGSFALIAGLTLIMAHTAVAAAVFPFLTTVYGLYTEDDKPTRFGKGLFMGMAWVAGAGSIITLLGSARGVVAVGFVKRIAGLETTFFGFTYYMLPIGAILVFLFWLFILVVYRPEKKTIPGLRQKIKPLSDSFGPISRSEYLTLAIVFLGIAIIGLKSLIPGLEPINKSAILLCTTILLFMLKILTIKDLEEIPWNVILLFGGAMSIGLCLYNTGAAHWLAVNWLSIFQHAHWFIFIMSIGLFVLVLTNFIVNVAAIAISLPMALAIAPYAGVTPDVVLFAALTTAGMPLMLLAGAAPNAIAYESRQYSSGEFFKMGVPASLLLLVVLGIFVLVIWPLMGMPVLVK